MKLKEFLKDKSYETYFDEKIKECKNLNELPRELNRCSCCERHKVNFPILGHRIPPNNIFKTTHGEQCNCPCRHIGRHLCREWDRIYEVDNLTETSEEDISEDDSYGSMEDFIVPDEGYTKKERKKLDKALDKFRGKKNCRR